MEQKFWVGAADVTIIKTKKGKPCIVFETNGNKLMVAMERGAFEELFELMEEDRDFGLSKDEEDEG